jgi:hypothetical protein
MIFSNISEVNYGTSFGMCVGYCKHDMQLKKDKTTFNCSGWAEQYPLQSNTINTNTVMFDSLKMNIKIKDFFELPEIIGCPDCADGGAEWIEIIMVNGEKHKVVFEYYNEPEILKNTLNGLRKSLIENNCNHYKEY